MKYSSSPVCASWTVKNPAVEQREVVVAVDQRGRMVRPGGVLVPDHVVAAGLSVRQGDVALGAGADGVDRPDRVAHVARHHVEHAVGGERLRDRDGVHPPEAPQLAAVEVVRAHQVAAGGHELGAALVLPDEGRGPVRALVAVVPPALHPGLGVERHQERLLVVVVDDVERPVVQHRRGRGTPPETRVRRLEAPLPDDGALHVEGVDADVAEVGVDPLAVGHRRRRGVGVLQVAVEVGPAGVHLRRPEDLAALEIDGLHQPVMDSHRALHQVARLRVAEPSAGGHRLRRAVGEIEPHARLLLFALADDGGQEDAVAPDHRRRPAEPGDRRLPDHVLGRAPGERQPRVVVGRRHRVGAPEGGPVLGCRGRRRGGDEGEQAGGDGDECGGTESCVAHRISLDVGGCRRDYTQDRGCRHPLRAARSAKQRVAGFLPIEHVIVEVAHRFQSDAEPAGRLGPGQPFSRAGVASDAVQKDLCMRYFQVK